MPAAVQGFLSAFPVAIFAIVLAICLGVTPALPISRSDAQPAPPPHVDAGDTTAIL